MRKLIDIHAHAISVDKEAARCFVLDKLMGNMPLKGWGGSLV